MKAILPFILLVLVGTTAIADEWYGSDKRLHFVCGYGIESAFELAARPYEGPARARRYAFAGVVTAAAGKETLDWLTGGEWSYKDAAWTVTGGLLSLGINKLLFN